MEDTADRERLALEVVNLAKASILTDNHFLAGAIGRLVLETRTLSLPFATDGFALAFDPNKLLRSFRQRQVPPAHSLMHSVAHCLFLHPYAGTSVDREAWNLACDIAAEQVGRELLGMRPDKTAMARMQIIERVERDLGRRASAERIYRELRDGRWADLLPSWAQTMKSDSHELWYGNASIGGDSAGQGKADTDGSVEPDESGSTEQRLPRPSAAQQQAAWRNTATSLAVNLQTLSSARGDELAELVEDLEVASQGRTDFAAFLRRFATPGEALRINDDEFDQIFYTYGLKLFDTLPLIEPLEYREERRVREFALVIDTSESVQGDAIRAFVAAAFTLLKSTESFFEQVHVRVIQCDETVRSDEKLTSLAELERWQSTMRVHGGGGTDFRPAFSYVDALVDAGEFWDLGGLVYFTDGLGTYPDWVPSYRTAFVFYDEDYPDENVPPWAVRVALDRDELARVAARSKRKEATTL